MEAEGSQGRQADGPHRRRGRRGVRGGLGLAGDRRGRRPLPAVRLPGGFLALKAWPTSLRTWGEAAAYSVRISNSARAELIASTMAVGKSVPGSIFRGAIQHEIPAFSKAPQTRSAIALSEDA